MEEFRPPSDAVQFKANYVCVTELTPKNAIFWIIWGQVPLEPGDEGAPTGATIAPRWSEGDQFGPFWTPFWSRVFGVSNLNKVVFRTICHDFHEKYKFSLRLDDFG